MSEVMTVPAPDFLCGLDAAIDVVGGKWKPLILWALNEQPRRFGELRRELDQVSEKVLVQQLRELERDDIVHREVHEQVPPKVVYSLTTVGVDLNRSMADLGAWGEQHLERIGELRREAAPEDSPK